MGINTGAAIIGGVILILVGAVICILVIPDRSMKQGIRIPLWILGLLLGFVGLVAIHGFKVTVECFFLVVGITIVVGVWSRRQQQTRGGSPR